ncbi:MAG: type II toxin-antitoxin system VapC family toxin [Solirubrobacterales bacterium]
MFADSSALVKLYADEPGHQLVRAHRELAISAIARVEVPAGLWHKHRLGEIDAETCRVMVAAFEADLGTGSPRTVLLTVALGPAVLDDAARLTGIRGLCAYDAVQLACARAARAADPAVDTFACFDLPLARAAATEGFASLDAA